MQHCWNESNNFRGSLNGKQQSVENELQQLYRMLVRQHRALLLCVCGRLFVAILLQAGPMSGETIPVRYPEGTTHGFLALRTLEGKLLPSDELTEALHGNRVVSHLLFRFKDGSLDDETPVCVCQLDLAPL